MTESLALAGISARCYYRYYRYLRLLRLLTLLPSFAKRVLSPLDTRVFWKEGLITLKSSRFYAKTAFKKGDLIHREQPLCLIDQGIFLPCDIFFQLGK